MINKLNKFSQIKKINAYEKDAITAPKIIHAEEIIPIPADSSPLQTLLHKKAKNKKKVPTTFTLKKSNVDFLDHFSKTQHIDNKSLIIDTLIEELILKTQDVKK